MGPFRLYPSYKRLQIIAFSIFRICLVVLKTKINISSDVLRLPSKVPKNNHSSKENEFPIFTHVRGTLDIPEQIFYTFSIYVSAKIGFEDFVYFVSVQLVLTPPLKISFFGAGREHLTISKYFAS